MVRMRGYDSVYERQAIKMSRKRMSRPNSLPSTSTFDEAKNSVSNGLLKLYKTATTAGSEADLSDDTKNLSKKSKRCSDEEDDEGGPPGVIWKVNKAYSKERIQTSKRKLDEEETPSKLTKKVKKTLSKAFVPQNSLLDLSHVGGVEYFLREIRDLFYHLDSPQLYQELKVQPVRAFLLHGPPGCGKSYLVKAIAGEYEMPLIEISAQELVCGVSGESENRIRDIFNSAVNAGRCILFLDNIDAITLKRETSNGGMDKRMVTQLMKCIDDLNAKDSTHNVMVIGATSFPDSIDTSLRVNNRFDRELVMGMPNEDAKLGILKILFNGVKLAPEVDLAWVAHQAAGYVAADLVKLVNIVSTIGFRRFQGKDLPHQQNSPILSLAAFRASRLSAQNVQISASEIQLELEDFKQALKECVPICKKEGFASVPDVTWEDVGALEHVRVELQKTILRPVKFHKYYELNRLRISQGILLYGPKGCGKTLIAKALANECNINFLSVNGPELMSMYLGESERAVRKCFERARHSAPCIIFFDEFDALCASRSNSPSSDATNRVVNQLLTEMDGMQERKLVFVIAATNRLEKIDSAMRRPGRLDKTIYIGLPSPKGRVDILRSLTKNKTCPKIEDDLSLERIAFDERCNGFSGADLHYLVGEATSSAMDRIEDITPKEIQYDKLIELAIKHELVLDWSHFDKAFQAVKLSFNKTDEKKFGQMERESRKELELDE